MVCLYGVCLFVCLRLCVPVRLTCLCVLFEMRCVTSSGVLFGGVLLCVCVHVFVCFCGLLWDVVWFVLCFVVCLCVCVCVCVFGCD